MARIHQGPLAEQTIQNSVVTIANGGTEATTAASAVNTLGGINIDKIGAANGLSVLDSSGLLPLAKIPSDIISSASISGLANLFINQVSTYTITNYNSFITYTITAISGSVSRSGDTITYTAPATSIPGGFIINGRTINIAIGTPVVNTPSITSPISGSTDLIATISATSSSFSMSTGVDVHESSDWQIATNVGFSSIAVQSLADTTNKTSWTATGLLPNTTYYFRVRYKSVSNGYSAYSSTITFTTKAVFAPTVEQAIITAADKNTVDYLGRCVSLDNSGNRVVIGVPGSNVTYSDTGAAYIFTRAGSTWTLEQKISASDKAAGDQFGEYVAISGDSTRIVIGAITADVGGFTDCGAVYVFLRTGTTWAQEAKLAASNKATSNYFGTSLSLTNDGSRFIVGSPYSGGNGRAYVFSRSGTTWSEEQIISPVSYYTNARFGIGVSISGDGIRCIVGAHESAPSSLAGAGEATVYFRSGTVWTSEQVLTASDKAGGESFGRSVSINYNGDRCVASAPNSTANGAGSGAGAAYVFTRSGTVWTQEAKLVASDKTSGDQFSYSVSINSDGSVIGSGAYTASPGGITQAGKAYMFTRSGTVWTQLSVLTASNKTSISNFGYSLCISGDGGTLISGAYNASPSSVNNAGSSYIYV